MARKVVSTPQGPAVQETERPKLVSTADQDELNAAAKDFFAQNTEKETPVEIPAAKAEEKPYKPAADRTSKLISNVPMLAKHLEKQGDEFSTRLLKRNIKNRANPEFDGMFDTADRFSQAYDTLKPQLKGVAFRDAKDVEIDPLQDFHKHATSLIFHAQQHLAAAQGKHFSGNASGADQSAEKLLAQKTATNIRPEDIATGGRDAVEKYAPISADAREGLSSESEAIGYINDFSKNGYLRQAANFSAMSAADHVQHAHHLLAGISQAIPAAVREISRTPELAEQAADSGIPFPDSEKVGRMFGSLANAFQKHAQKFVAGSRPDRAKLSLDELAQVMRPKTVHDAFGLNHHLTRLEALRSSNDRQQLIENQLATVHDVYTKHYSTQLNKQAEILAKREAGRGHLVSTDVPSIGPGANFVAPQRDLSKGTTGAATPLRPYEDDNGEMQAIRKEHNNGQRYARLGTEAKSAHDYDRQLSGDLVPGFAHSFNEDGSYNKEESLGKLSELYSNKEREVLSARGSALTALAGTHSLAPKWQAAINKATTGLGTKRGHALLDTVETSMSKYGLRRSEPVEVRTVSSEQSGRTLPVGTPSLEEFGDFANVRKPVVESDSDTPEPGVDLTFGGKVDPKVGIPVAPERAFPGQRFDPEPPKTVKNPSRRGFFVPLPGVFESERKKSRRDAARAAVAAARNEVEQPAQQPAEQPAKSSSTYLDPFLYGTGGVQPLDFSKGLASKDVSDNKDRFKKGEADEDGLLLPAVDRVAVLQAKDDSTQDLVEGAMSDAEEKAKQERAASFFNDRRGK